jgi:hypothetical protein
MEKTLLTKVITQLVNDRARAQEYGVALVNIPDFDYVSFVQGLASERKAALFFLGFPTATRARIESELPQSEKLSYDFTVEKAEESRNSGDESIFRVLIIKRAEMEKMSSLRWFPEITLERIYTKSCDLARKDLAGTNAVIEALIQALRSKPIRSILSFERVLEYLELLISAPADKLPEAIKENYYRLGLCSDKSLDSRNPSKDDFVARIKHNHGIVERLSNLEQAERQSITNYYAKATGIKETPRRILSYYKTKDIALLGQMELSEVEECLKAAKEKKNPTPPPRRGTTIKPTALAAQLIFDDNQDQISDILVQLERDIDQRANTKKAEKVEVDVDGGRAQFKTEPVTERIAEEMSSDSDFGGIIRAEVQAPDEAIRDLDKFERIPFSPAILDPVWSSLTRIAALVSDGETISVRLKRFLDARKEILPFSKRLQDAPMLQVLAQFDKFYKYLTAYAGLLTAINDEFPKIWAIAPSNAKEIINTIMSLDYVFVVGETKAHAIPTPMHPMYLWKYVELAKEILSSKGVNEIGEAQLSDEDKAFIIRKAEDIPDPLSVALLPATIAYRGAAFLPLSGRIGMLPVYSNVPQINQSESGIDTLKQAIIRYLCLYPHAGMMLKLCVIDPPSVEVIVSMLKALNSDKEFNINGIEISIFHTKEVSASWIEIDDDSLNDGMLGRIKGRRSLNFKLTIAHHKYSYSKILSELSREQHMLIIFDPNEVKIETAQNNRQIHIHPLCVPKVYKYNPIDEKVEIRPASEGGIFTVYASIIEKLNEHPSTFSHTSTSFYTPLKRETYDAFLDKCDWLVILDQSLKSWDISLRAASEKLFYRENDYRSIGIYSSNCRKFVLGYDTLVKRLGNFVPKEEGVKEIIEAVREINDDGLLSIVSHTSNRIFDTNHGKGSLGIALAAIHYKRQHPAAILVGLDTQLAQEWLSDREDGKLPDLIGINLESDTDALVDIIEVKTYSDNPNAFTLDGDTISGHAVEQVTALEGLTQEMLGKTEKITTISRREILREQVFECLFQAALDPASKLRYSNMLNDLFAGEYNVSIRRNIAFVDFENTESSEKIYKGIDDYVGKDYTLITIGSSEVQAILANSAFAREAGPFNPAPQEEDTAVVAPSQEPREASAAESTPEEAQPVQSPVVPATMPVAVSNIPVASASPVPATDETVVELQRTDIREKCAKINKVFRDYGINAYPVDPDMVQEAARFTRFSVELKSGETIRTLERFKTDIGIQLEANGEILIDHIKGTKYLSVDVPFAGAGKSISLLEHLSLLDGSSGDLDFVAGQKADGRFEIVDLAKAPHMLIAGTTGSGKTIFLYSIIVSLLHKYPMEDLEFLIIDPKQTDFVFFEDLPNLYGGHVVIDAEEALEMIQRINDVDKEERMQQIRSCRSRDINSYNEKNPDHRMKRLIIIIDEYADLIQTAEMQGKRKEFEKFLSMLAQKVRSLGIHLIIATQRPSANIVTGVLKANIPYRISFRLPSHTDSQTILDMSGAENLLGKGDMLLVTDSDTIRMQGLFISENELDEFVKSRQ